MEKRFQVFVSSTYADLQQERQRVIQTVMEMDCIPAGMELFPAADEEQWQFIKRVIDDCDYYILIIGGRYGSLTPEGISYTEQEFDYAVSRDIKVLVFVHERPDDIPVGKSDIDPELRAKLDAFREKAATSRLVKFWTRAEELPGLVALSLSKTIKLYPAVGWVRADSLANEQALADLNELRKDNDVLRKKLAKLKVKEAPEQLNLAGLEETIGVRITWQNLRQYSQTYIEEVTDTWSNIFAAIAPSLAEHPSDSAVNATLAEVLYCKLRETTKSARGVRAVKEDFETVRVQLSTLGLVKVSYNSTTKGGRALFWTLTPKGQQLMLQLRTVKSQR